MNFFKWPSVLERTFDKLQMPSYLVTSAHQA